MDINWILNPERGLVSALDLSTMTVLAVHLIDAEAELKYKWNVWNEDDDLALWGFSEDLEMGKRYAEAACLLGREYYKHLLALSPQKNLQGEDTREG